MKMVSMREIMDAVAILTEARIETVAANNNEVRVFINPSQRELENIIQNASFHDARGFFDLQWNLYLWNGDEAIHHQVKKAMGFLDDETAGEIILYANTIVAFQMGSMTEDQFRAIPVIARLYRNKDYIVDIKQTIHL